MRILVVAAVALAVNAAQIRTPDELYKPLDGFGVQAAAEPQSKSIVVEPVQMVRFGAHAADDAAQVLADALQEQAPLMELLRVEATEEKALKEDREVEKSHPEEQKDKTAATAMAVLQPYAAPFALAGGSPTKAKAPSTVANHNKDVPSEFENSVTEMVLGLQKMNKQGVSATPMGSSVNSMRDMIEGTMMKKVRQAHTDDVKMLDDLHKAAGKCDTTRTNQMLIASKQEKTYKSKSTDHKSCRAQEGALLTQLKACNARLTNAKMLKDMICNDFSTTKKRLGSQTSNIQIVTKGAQEPIEVYIKRLTSTIAGMGCGGKGGSGKGGFLDVFLTKKEKCVHATKKYSGLKTQCGNLNKDYSNRKLSCNNVQDMMDNAACNWAIQTKDACEGYAECFLNKQKAYALAENQTKKNEKDRKAEWRGLKRMQCLINSFGDGSVTDSEVTKCKETTHNTDYFTIKYTPFPKMKACAVPNTYPTTAEYKKVEFVPLPVLAKGNPDANECTGVLEISTTPASGSPTSCKCERVTLNGPYSPGPIVKCLNCLDVQRSTQKNSCPEGTKLFSPTSRQDWSTFLGSANPLRAPNWIIDVTRPQNGCGGCQKSFMNSDVAEQKTWKTSDGSPWWLRSTKYNEPNGDYHANCYLDLWHTPRNSDSVTWNDLKCNYHSKSYYCQRMAFSTKPKVGSPAGCACKRVELVGKYSAGMLVKCEQCKTVRRTTEMNSCPVGMKIFSPSSQEDWKTFIKSASPLRAPHWIIDVTRPQNGCGGCTRFAMNSQTTEQKTWRTQDKSQWWLRSTRYGEPNGDYHANCYLDLWRTPVNEHSVTFNDGSCSYHSRSYYCQPAKKGR